jgi:hypothetical protein
VSKKMSEADWVAVAWIFHAVHQRRALKAEAEARRVPGANPGQRPDSPTPISKVVCDDTPSE